MKEIDLLPSWYKSGRRRRVSYRTQYAALGGIFVVILVWNFVAGYSISKATTELAEAETKIISAESSSNEFAKIESELAQLKKKTTILNDIDSKIDVASVLGEISFLIDKHVVLSKVELKAGRIANSKTGQNSSSAVRVAGGYVGGKDAVPLGDVRFKVVISGVASDASDVAGLICKLEESPYFCQVIPQFSRSRKTKTGPSHIGEDFEISEFEISCELANYRATESLFNEGTEKREAGR
ncbi:MAG: hypothetical protein JSV82_03055 [Planctomycetota bacterium]|nr:MAG: hypothetical protein JSV82_03055 [Planctomycetota bacterium]